MNNNETKSEIKSETVNEIENETVNHPEHYTQGGVECIDAIAAAVEGARGIEAVYAGNVIKYVWRYRRKNGAEDLKKCRWYLERLIAEVEKNG